AMNVKKNNLEKSEIELVVSIDWKDWSSFIDQSLEEIGKEVKIEGFRPGKAPKDMIEQKVGKDFILNDAAQKAIHKTYPEILAKEKIDAIGQPKVEILKIAEGNPLEYKVETTVMPEITLSPWRAAVKKVNKENSTETVEVDEKDVDAELEKIAQSRAELVKVDRVAKDGDSIEIDFDASQDNVPIENGSSKNHNLVLGSGSFIPGFEEQLLGTKAGDEKEFELTFPKEYHAKHLAGKPTTFKVKVNAVQERKVPKIDDELAKSLGKFENLKALKDVIIKGMTEEKNQKLNEKKRSDIVEEIVKLTEVEIPQMLLDEEISKMSQEFESQIQGMGMQMDQYLEQIKKTKEDLMKDWAPQAEKRIKSALALEEIVKTEEINVDAKDVEDEMNKTMQMYKDVKDAKKNIDMARLYNYTKGMLQNAKVFEMLEKL
ncbi:trigger factor, partial [Patescibacteria group bacterium]